RSLALELERDGAVGREFCRIAQKIEQALLELGAVGVKSANVRWALNVEAIRIFCSKRTDDRAHLLDERRKGDIFQIEFELSGLDFGEVENVAHETQTIQHHILDVGEI